MRILITGGAGFIGSNLALNLSSKNHEVIVFDNFTTGHKEFLENFNGRIVKGDLLTDRPLFQECLKGVDEVYHLSANADVKDGWEHPRKDFEQNLIATLNVLEDVANNGIGHVVFSSTGSIYGESKIIPTPENCPLPAQTSLYGASKMSAENFINAYCEAGKIKATIFRFVSILGPHYTHGHIRDFLKQLMKDSSTLNVLGNGNQEKSYLHVNDCIEAITEIRGSSDLEVFNLGRKETCTVKQSIDYICKTLKISPSINYGLEDRGWVGDNPLILLDTSRANASGWEPKINIEDAIIDTANWLLKNQEYL